MYDFGVGGGHVKYTGSRVNKIHGFKLHVSPREPSSPLLTPQGARVARLTSKVKDVVFRYKSLTSERYSKPSRLTITTSDKYLPTPRIRNLNYDSSVVEYFQTIDLGML